MPVPRQAGHQVGERLLGRGDHEHFAAALLDYLLSQGVQVGEPFRALTDVKPGFVQEKNQASLVGVDPFGFSPELRDHRRRGDVACNALAFEEGPGSFVFSPVAVGK